MEKIIFNDKDSNGALIGLSELMTRLPPLPISVWAFKNITLVYPEPFGITVESFEILTRKLDLGFLVSDSDFRIFLDSKNYQIIDGIIAGYSDLNFNKPSIVIDCFDTSAWEVNVRIVGGDGNEVSNRNTK
jgi:hypothetical protein